MLLRSATAVEYLQFFLCNRDKLHNPNHLCNFLYSHHALLNSKRRKQIARARGERYFIGVFLQNPGQIHKAYMQIKGVRLRILLYSNRKTVHIDRLTPLPQDLTVGNIACLVKLRCDRLQRFGCFNIQTKAGKKITKSGILLVNGLIEIAAPRAGTMLRCFLCAKGCVGIIV